MAKVLDELLNDGVLNYGEILTERDSHKKKTGERFIQLDSLFFNYASINQSFDEWHVGNLQEVTLKVKVYFTKNLHRSHRVDIENELYEIKHIDPDNDRKYAYLFLKKVGVLDANSRLSDS